MGFKKHSRLKSFLLISCLFISQSPNLYAYDFSTGVFQFQQKLAAKGDPQAQYKLANMYENGQGVKADLDKALLWYKKSAAQNYNPAKMRITYIEIKKNGYNPAKHAAWLNKLKEDAANEDGESLFLLATLYKNGFILDKNLNKAAGLFKRASNKNIPGAETELESISSALYAEKSRRRALERRQKQEAEKRRKEQQQAFIRKKSEEERNKQLAIQRAERERLMAEKERMELAQEKQRLLLEKRRLEERQRALLLKQQVQAEQQQAAIEPQAEPEAVPEVKKKSFDKNICKGKKARFLTICR